MKRFSLWGALFGLVLVPVSTLGLVSPFIEFTTVPLILPTTATVNALIDTATSPGALSLGLLALVSTGFYALIGAGLGSLCKTTGKTGAAVAAVLLYALLAWLVRL